MVVAVLGVFTYVCTPLQMRRTDGSFVFTPVFAAVGVRVRAGNLRYWAAVVVVLRGKRINVTAL